MRRHGTAIALIAGLAAASLTIAGSAAEPRKSLRERIAERRAERTAQKQGDAGPTGRLRDRLGPRGKPDRTLTYGPDPKQTIGIYAAPQGSARPGIIVYIHGGGWRHGDDNMVAYKPDYARGRGLAFASLGYRMLPDAPVETQLADIALALDTLRAQAGRLGFDPDRILLMGHSAGAHIAAMIGTDQQLTRPDTFAAIRGVVLLDGAGYNVPVQMKMSPLLSRKIYLPAFGDDPARQKALSPVTPAGAPNAPDWLIIHDDSRKDSKVQSEELAKLLRGAGSRADVLAEPGTHATLNRDFGTDSYPAKAEVDAFVGRVLR